MAACLAGVALSGALQAVFATLGGLSIVLVGYLGSRDDAVARLGVAAVLGTGAAAAVLAVLGTFRLGPLSFIAGQGTFQLRIDSWTAAWRMFVADPLTGVGLDRHAAYYRAYRPERSALTRTAEDFADAPHNVPLGMFSSGGIVLGLLYLAAVVTIAVVAVRAWRRADASGRRLLGLAGGALVAYLVQSLVSIDVPALVALHGLFAGMVLSAAGGTGWRERAMPWRALERPPARPPPAGLRGSDSRGRARQQGPGPAAVLTGAVAALVAVVAVVVVSRPVRADVASYEAQAALDQGRADEAVPGAERAQALAPWRPEYHVQEARAHIAAERLEPALDALLEALERDPRDMDALVTAARVADRLERHDLSVELYRRMVELEPQAPDLLREAAETLERNGHTEEAAALLARVRALEG
ncbi:MAG TPA: O-antigen ligase family protein [Nitriliruptorales bacterium]